MSYIRRLFNTLNLGTLNQRLSRRSRRSYVTTQVAWALATLESRTLLSIVGVGTDQIVNTYTIADQSNADVATSSSGSYVVVWQSIDQGSDPFDGIYAQQYNEDGTRKGSEIHVNTAAGNGVLNGQNEPRVAMAPDGKFAVVWTSHLQDGDGQGVYMRTFSVSGGGSSVVRVNTTTAGQQWQPDIQYVSNDDLMVVWSSSLGQDASGFGVYGQRFNSEGVRIGSELLINENTNGHQRAPQIAADSSGAFAVAWLDNSNPSTKKINAQFYNSTGTKQGSEFNVAFATSERFAMACTSPGTALFTWTVTETGGNENGVRAARFNSSGTPIGTLINVNSTVSGNQQPCSVSIGPNGVVTYAWMSDSQDGSGSCIVGRQFTLSGFPLGGEVILNTFTPGTQDFASVAPQAAGGFVCVWTTSGLDQNGSGVAFRRFQNLAEIDVIESFTLINGVSNINFGTTTAGVPITRTFRVKNTGSVDLSVNAVSSPAGFSVTTNFVANQVISPGNEADFTVRFNANFVGTSSGSISFVNSDADENPFNFSVSATVHPPEIQVLVGTVNIADGTGDLPLGSTTVGTPISTTITVKNLGGSDLIVNPVIVPTGFSVPTNFSSGTVICAGAQVSFTIRLDALVDGNFSGDLSFSNNDGDENPFDFTVSGIVANLKPTITSGNTFDVWEGTTAVAMVTATDPEAAALRYGMFGGVDKSKFLIDSGTGALTLVSALDFEVPTDANANNVYEVTVSVSDGSNLVMQEILVTVRDVNEVPSDIQLSNSIVAEQKPDGTIVGAFTTSDSDSGNTFAYIMAAGTGSSDNDNFIVDASGKLRTGTIFDFETKSNYSVRVRSSDQGNLFVEKVFSISIDALPIANLLNPVSGTTRVTDPGYVDVNWIDPNAIMAGIDPSTIDVNDISIVNDGRTLTIVSVTDQGGGVWRYRYAEALHAAADGSALPVQVTFVAGQVKDLAANANVAASASFAFDNVAPKVLASAQNSGQVNPTPSGPTTWAQQRSRMASYTVTFSEPVQSVTPSNVQLINLGVNAPATADITVTLLASQLSLNAARTQLTLTFPASGTGSLADGVYLLRVLPTLTDGANSLDGDGNGTGGDAYVVNGNATNKFFVLRGDWNGSGGVNLLDYATFAAFNTKAVGSTGAPAYVDLNNSGGVNLLDYGIFAANFGKFVVFDATAAAGSANGGSSGAMAASLASAPGIASSASGFAPTLVNIPMAAATPTPLTNLFPAITIQQADEAIRTQAYAVSMASQHQPSASPPAKKSSSSAPGPNRVLGTGSSTQNNSDSATSVVTALQKQSQSANELHLAVNGECIHAPEAKAPDSSSESSQAEISVPVPQQNDNSFNDEQSLVYAFEPAFDADEADLMFAGSNEWFDSL